MATRKRSRTTGFTIVELLVVVSIIALLIGILLPAIGRARDQARVTMSQANLRQMAIAHAGYAAEWNDAQLSLTDYSLARYGLSAGAAIQGYKGATGSDHPGIILGWGHGPGGTGFGIWGYYFTDPLNAELASPMDFNSGFGWFRMPNVQAFNQYLSGRFYDPVFYAPKDKVVMSVLEPWLSNPDEYVPTLVTGNSIWSSYCLSPAALFNPQVLGVNGFRDPYSIAGGLRTPSMGQAAHPDLKTHMIEHHWLQNNRADCNASFTSGTYDGCEPFYFCHSMESVPQTLFYDGHISSLGMAQAFKADERQFSRAGGVGLWNRTTPMQFGYFGEEAYDFRVHNLSTHILTTDGILGRDTVGN